MEGIMTMEDIVLDLTMRGGEALLELREKAGLTREALAVYIGRASSTVELWEAKGKPIKNTDIVKVAQVLAERLVGDDGLGEALRASLALA